MKFHDLQAIVTVEVICLLLLIVIIFATFKRWKRTLLTSGFFATLAFFSAWSNIMALGSTCVYGSASMLLWWQMSDKSEQSNKSHQVMQKLSWAVLITGVAILILNNLRNIFIYLRH